MKKATITLALLFASLIGFSQNKTAKGTVLDGNNRLAITNAVLKINDTSISAYTNNAGKFSIEVPKSFHKLTVQHDDFIEKEIILRPGFQLKPFKVYLKSIYFDELVKKEEKTRDSIYKSRKNTLSLSVLELFNATLAGFYEHLFSEKHSLGDYFSIYIYGRNLAAIGGSEYDYYPHYQGFKFAPNYRFYPIKNNRILFIEGKLQLGYIYFSDLEYHYSSMSRPSKIINYSTWTGGFGASVGTKFHANKVILTLVLGYQYFPIQVPESVNMELNDGTILNLPTDISWWYQGGPGTPFVFKFLIGGAF